MEFENPVFNEPNILNLETGGLFIIGFLVIDIE
jgi:hypothetical protein